MSATTQQPTGEYLEVFGTSSPNVVKVQLLLKYLKIPHVYHNLSIRKGDQFTEDFLKINPNGKFPALLVHKGDGSEPIRVFESGNILLFLAQNYAGGDKLFPSDLRLHTESLNWVFFQMGNLGPAFGGYYHYKVYALEKYDYPYERHLNELKRQLRLLDQQVAKTGGFIVGKELNVADFAIYPWTRYVFGFVDGLTKEDIPNLFEYNQRMSSVPAIAEFETQEKEERSKAPPQQPPTEEERKWMFNRERN